jgi:hypothetical protein
MSKTTPGSEKPHQHDKVFLIASTFDENALMELARIPHPASPRLTITGRDELVKPITRGIVLSNFPYSADNEVRLAYMEDTGTFLLNQYPEVWRLEEAHFIQKLTADLSKAGFGKAEDVIVIAGINFAKNDKDYSVLNRRLSMQSLSILKVLTSRFSIWTAILPMCMSKSTFSQQVLSEPENGISIFYVWRVWFFSQRCKRGL